MDEDELEESNDSSKFMVVDSQTETQEYNQQEILLNLPALRQQESQVIEVSRDVTLKPKVLVSATDSDVDFHARSPTEDNEVVMETQSEHKSSSISSEQETEVTVIEKTELDKVDKDSKSSSKDFQLFRPSLSENDVSHNSDDEPMVTTPAEYIGSLHFSGQPLLVPESVDESLNEISASPGVYGDVPVIIPSTPPRHSDEDSDEHDEGSNEKQTSNSQSRVIPIFEMETQNQDQSLHLALSETVATLVERDIQGLKQTDVGFGSQDLALHLTPSQTDSMFTLDKGNSEKTRKKFTRMKSASQPELSEKFSSRPKSNSTPTDSVGGFHLSLPSDGNLLHPALRQSTEKSNSDTREAAALPTDAPSLTLGLMETSQSTSEAVFHLEKPDLQLTETGDQSEMNIFIKTKAGVIKPHHRVFNDSSEDFLDFHSEKPQHSQSFDKSIYDESTEIYKDYFGEEDQDNPLSSKPDNPLSGKPDNPLSKENPVSKDNHVSDDNPASIRQDNSSVSNQDNLLSNKEDNLVCKEIPASTKQDNSAASNQDNPLSKDNPVSGRPDNPSLTQSYPQTPLSSKKRKLLHRKPAVKRGQRVMAVSSTELEDNSKTQPPVKKRKPSLKKFTELLQRTNTSKTPTKTPAVTASTSKLIMSPTSTTQEPHPEISIQSPRTSVQSPRTSIQSSRTDVQSPRTSIQSTSKRRNVEFADVEHSQVEFSLDQPLSGSPDSDELLEKTTIVETTRIHRQIKIVIMSAKDGHVVKTTEREEVDKPMFLREVVVTKRLNPLISPSRTNSSLTSGDLGDISSCSLSRISSLESKRGSLEKTGSSLDVASLSKSQPDVIERRNRKEIIEEGNHSIIKSQNVVDRRKQNVCPEILDDDNPNVTSISKSQSEVIRRQERNILPTIPHDIHGDTTREQALVSKSQADVIRQEIRTFPTIPLDGTPETSISKTQADKITPEMTSVSKSQNVETRENDTDDGTPDVSVIEKTDSRYGAVVSSAESKKTDSLFTSPEVQKTSAVLSKSPEITDFSKRLSGVGSSNEGSKIAQVSESEITAVKSSRQRQRISGSSDELLDIPAQVTTSVTVSSVTVSSSKKPQISKSSTISLSTKQRQKIYSDESSGIPAAQVSKSPVSSSTRQRQERFEYTDESSGIPASQVTRTETQVSRLSDSSSDSLLALERERRQSQESAGFSVHGSGVTMVTCSNQSTKVSTLKKTGISQAEKRLRDSASTGESDKLSPVIPVQTDAVAMETSAMRTPAKRHYASKLEEGAIVMARWKDGFYYPGKILNMEEITRYRIQFDDGDSRLVKVTDILLIEELPIGQSVMVMSQDGYFDCGLIVEHVYDADILTYTVERDNGSRKKCLRSDIILSEDQASCLMSDDEIRITVSTPVDRKPAEVSLDNLIEGSRRSTTKTKPQSDVPRSIGKQKRQTKMVSDKPDDVQPSTEKKKRGRGLQATSTPTPSRVAQTGRTPKRACETTPRKTKHRLRSRSPSPLGGAVNSPVSVCKTPRKGKGFTTETHRASTLCEQSTSRGEMKIFAGMVFLLSHVDKSTEQREQEKKMLQDSSLETSAEENLIEDEPSLLFDKDYLKTEIERASGVVIDKYIKTQIDAAIACYLISDTYQRTVKYLQCLAAGIPCVSHLWVRESLRQGKCLDIKAYLLPAGISLQRRKLMECKSHANCLEGYKVMIVSTNTNFMDAWTDTLTICKCNLFNRLPPPDVSDDMMLDVVVTDYTCPINILRRARKLEIPVVSTEWVIQCLINAHQVGYDVHPRYKHDFIESQTC